jgi:hypothetical protein
MLTHQMSVVSFRGTRKPGSRVWFGDFRAAGALTSLPPVETAAGYRLVDSSTDADALDVWRGVDAGALSRCPPVRVFR